MVVRYCSNTLNDATNNATASHRMPQHSEWVEIWLALNMNTKCERQASKKNTAEVQQVQ